MGWESNDYDGYSDVGGGTDSRDSGGWASNDYDGVSSASAPGLDNGGFIDRSPIGNHAFGPNSFDHPDRDDGADYGPVYGNSHTQDPAVTNAFSVTAARALAGKVNTSPSFLDIAPSFLDVDAEEEYQSFFGGANAALKVAEDLEVEFSDRLKDFAGINNGGFAKSKAAKALTTGLSMLNPVIGAASEGLRGIAAGQPLDAVLGMASLGTGKFGLAAAGLKTANEAAGFFDEEFGIGPGGLDKNLNTGAIMAGLPKATTSASLGPARASTDGGSDQKESKPISVAQNQSPSEEVSQLYTYKRRSFSRLNTRTAGIRRIA